MRATAPSEGAGMRAFMNRNSSTACSGRAAPESPSTIGTRVPIDRGSSSDQANASPMKVSIFSTRAGKLLAWSSRDLPLAPVRVTIGAWPKDRATRFGEER
jgi:hypothetical protein